MKLTTLQHDRAHTRPSLFQISHVCAHVEVDVVAAVQDVLLTPGGKVGRAGEADGGRGLEGGGGEGEGEHDEETHCS